MMKWIFKKEDEECKVFLRKTNKADMDFSYIDMVKALYEEKQIESAEFEGDFSDDEKESVNLLIDEINKHAHNFFELANEERDSTL